MALVVVHGDDDYRDRYYDSGGNQDLREIADEKFTGAINQRREFVGRLEFFLAYLATMGSRRHQMLQRAPPGRGSEEELARTRLHFVLEIFGRHPLEDLGPFVARDAGEVLIRSLWLTLRFVKLARGLEHFFGHVDGRLGAQCQRYRVTRARIYFEILALASLHLDAREIGALAQFSYLRGFDGGAELGEQIAQQVMRHRTLRLDSLELGGHRSGLERSDPDMQIELIVGILQDHNRHLCGWVESNSPNHHQNEIFLVSCHRKALQPLLLKGARKNYFRIPGATG